MCLRIMQLILKHYTFEFEFQIIVVRYLFILGFAFCSSLITAQIDPVKWNFEIEKMDENTFQVHFKASMEKNWVIYSQYTSQGGPLPTEFSFDQNPSIDLVEDVIELDEPKVQFDALFEIDVTKFEKEAHFVQKIQTKSENQVLEGYVRYMSCNGMKCLPPKNVDFSLSLK